MSTLLILLLPPLVGLLVILLVAIWGTNNLVENLVGKKHRLLEEIITNREIPEGWSTDFTRAQRRLQNDANDANDSNNANDSNDSSKARQLQKRQAKTQKKLLRQLDKLTRYAQTTPLVADEDTRQVLLMRLEEARADWATRDFDEFW